jgi:hypothetical protein
VTPTPKAATVKIPPARFVRREDKDKRLSLSDGDPTPKAPLRRLSHGYKILPKKDSEERKLKLKTKNVRARARIEKVMSRLHED